MTFTTYRKLGNYWILDENLREIFIDYMTERWKDTERQKCLDGYAQEWAMRFKNGVAYAYSDTIGQGILSKLGYKD